MSLRLAAFVLFMTVIFTSGFSADAEVRNYFSFSAIDYDGIGTSNVVENTVVAGIRPNVSLLVRLYHDHRDNWNNSIGTFGAIVNLDDHHYFEMTYGYGRDSDERRADYISAELTRETARYLTGLGFMYRSYPSYTYTTVSPSIKYRLHPKVSLWGKYFASMDSDDNFDHAYWTDVEYFFTPRFSLSAGYTGGNRLYSPEYDALFGGHSDMSFYSVLGRLSYRYSETLTARYLYEHVTRQSKFNDIKHIIVIAIRFL